MNSNTVFGFYLFHQLRHKGSDFLTFVCPVKHLSISAQGIGSFNKVDGIALMRQGQGRCHPRNAAAHHKGRMGI